MAPPPARSLPPRWTDACLPPTLLLDLFLGRPTAIGRARSPPALSLPLSVVSPSLEFLRCPLSRFFSIVLLVCRPPGRGPPSPLPLNLKPVSQKGWASASGLGPPARSSSVLRRAPIREIESLGRRIVLGLPSFLPFVQKEGRKKGCPIKFGAEAGVKTAAAVRVRVF